VKEIRRVTEFLGWLALASWSALFMLAFPRQWELSVMVFFGASAAIGLAELAHTLWIDRRY